MATAINVAVTDQGLHQILSNTEVPEPLIQYLLVGCSLRHTTDFSSYVPQGTYETEIADIVKGKFPVVAAADGVEGFTAEQQRLYVARARAALKLAFEVQQRVKTETEKEAAKEDLSHPDMERPLDTATIERLDDEWLKKYSFRFIAHMRPAPAFRNRVFRELRMKVARLIPVEKVRSMEENKVAADPVHIEVGGSGADGGHLIYETHRKLSRHVGSLLDYLTALRIIMYTYAYCGTHLVSSQEDASKKIVFFPLEQAMGYVDEATVALGQIRLSTDAERMAWLRKRDETTRSEMVSLLNDGLSGGEAIKQAWTKMAHLWVMRDGLNYVAADAPPEAQGLKRQRDDKGKGGAKGKAASSGGGQGGPRAALRTATKNAKGKKLCGAFNGNKGCSLDPRSCPQAGLHVCSVILPNGQICGSNRGGALDHPHPR